MEQREGERSGPRRPPASASVCHLSQFAAQVGRPFSPSSPPLLLPALGSLSGSGRWGPSPGPGAAGLRVEAVAGPPRAWPWPLRPPSSALLHLSGGRKRGGTADKRPGTQQTLIALETLPNQHAFSPPFENKNGARMDRWEAGSRSQLRRAGGRFPEGTGVRGRAWGHLRGQGPRMGRCDQQAGGQAVSACAHQPHGGYRKGGGGGLTRPCLCGCEDRGHPHTGVRCPGGRPRGPDLLAAAEVIQRTARLPSKRLCSARDLLLASWLRASSVFPLVTGKSAPFHQDRCQPGFSAFLCLGGKRGQGEPVICDHTA